MGQVEVSIVAGLKELSVEHLELSNESYMHAVPKNSETHFKLVLVSEAFV